MKAATRALKFVCFVVVAVSVVKVCQRPHSGADFGFTSFGPTGEIRFFHNQFNGQRVPNASWKTFYGDNTTIHDEMHSAIPKAFALNGYRRVDKQEDAHIVWLKQVSKLKGIPELKPWQRLNYFEKYLLLEDKGYFHSFMHRYSQATNRSVDFMPLTFRLDKAKEVSRLMKHFSVGGGRNVPWILKRTTINRGKGLTVIPPNSNVLASLEKSLKHTRSLYRGKKERYVLQEFLCDLPLLNGHKFDIRVFMLVLSVDPLIVLFREGYLRYASLPFAGNYSSGLDSLITNASSGGKEDTWDVFKTILKTIVASNKRELLHLENGDPYLHVKKQLKHILVEVVRAYKSTTFAGDANKACFSLYAVDFVINNKLDAFLLETQLLPQLWTHDAAGKSRLAATKASIALVEELQEKQMRNEPVFPLRRLDGFEVIYTEKEQFEFKMNRRRQNKC